MVTKGYLTLTRAPEIEPHHQIQFSVITPLKPANPKPHSNKVFSLYNVTLGILKSWYLWL